MQRIYHFYYSFKTIFYFKNTSLLQARFARRSF